jgi:hypothetical protein
MAGLHLYWYAELNGRPPGSKSRTLPTDLGTQRVLLRQLEFTEMYTKASFATPCTS